MFCSRVNLQDQQSFPPSPFLPARQARQVSRGWKITSLWKSSFSTTIEGSRGFSFLLRGFDLTPGVVLEEVLDGGSDFWSADLTLEIFFGFLLFLVLNFGLLGCFGFLIFPVKTGSKGSSFKHSLTRERDVREFLLVVFAAQYVPSTGQNCELADLPDRRDDPSLEKFLLCGGGGYTGTSCLTLTDAGWEVTATLLEGR